MHIGQLRATILAILASSNTPEAMWALTGASGVKEVFFGRQPRHRDKVTGKQSPKVGNRQSSADSQPVSCWTIFKTNTAMQNIPIPANQ